MQLCESVMTPLTLGNKKHKQVDNLNAMFPM